MVTSHEWSYTGARGTLVARTWSDPDRRPTHVLLLAHGYGEHVGRYERVAEVLVGNGAVVYAVDHQGHGKSDGEQVLVHDYEEVVSDLHALSDRARAEQPGLPVVLVGHSMGGLIAARYAQRYRDELAALVLSGPLIGEGSPMLGLLELEEIPDVPLDISTLSRDPEVGKAYDSDPLVWHGPFKRATLQAIDVAMRAVQDGPALGDLPTLWVHGEDDQLVPIAVTRSGIEHLRGSDFRSQVYPGARHEVFNETNADEVLGDVTAFVSEVLGRPARG